jgi:hypothetical protein
MIATFSKQSSVTKVVEREKLYRAESIPSWAELLVVILQGQKHVRIAKIAVLGQSWPETTMMATFFSSCSACKVLELQKLPHTESNPSWANMSVQVIQGRNPVKRGQNHGFS